MRNTNEITGEIIEVAFRLHSRLGPGLLESVYEIVLAKLLQERGLHVERQKAVTFEFDGCIFDDGLRVDLFVEHSVVVELKAIDKVAPVHVKQVLTYLRLLDLPVGLLINFGTDRMKDGLQRITNFAARSKVDRS
ncbi:MAG TPA: GxxExxY protein [Longimicrobium sp.]|nr:GxxExxY protein [Longimicrobium sp.]